MDKRIISNIQVKDHLSEATFRLLVRKNLSEISISELISEAGVARSSFYRNFSTIEDILKYELKKIQEQYIAESPLSYVDYTNREFLIWVFQFWQQRAEKLLILNNVGLSYLVLEAINEILMLDIDPNTGTVEDKWMVYFGAGAFYNVVIHWLECGCVTPENQLAEYFSGFYSHGFQPKSSRNDTCN